MDGQRITQAGVSTPMAPFLNKHKPWVSVICTSFNQVTYIQDSLHSVVGQTYPNVELIIVDNASTDGSAEQIRSFCKKYPATQFIHNITNRGLCRAFNQGLARAVGEYVIDLSADDVMLPNRISRQIEQFLSLPAYYGVVFSNATYINESGEFLRHHHPVRPDGRTTERVPTGDVFQEVLTRYFINTPTMMMRRDMLTALGGYDESLAYEDFDLWVRSARHYRYAYIDEVLTQKRLLADSLGQQVVRVDNQLLDSTWRVCQKAYALCQTTDEYKALADRLRQFIRKCFYAEQYELASKFGRLLGKIEPPGLASRAILLLCRMHLPVNGMYRRYRLATK
ncbi:glycosyltransferase [Fibrella aestuarina]|uniref:Glycosyltransferase n=2 Tax=Fibrivirga algicola TaxID=2950420 RepID=A0ABX0QDW0_9BACT|nr:glycosyltransferase [Fibrivirga algicola]